MQLADGACKRKLLDKSITIGNYKLIIGIATVFSAALIVLIVWIVVSYYRKKTSTNSEVPIQNNRS